jgi:hypothetical protein
MREAGSGQPQAAAGSRRQALAILGGAGALAAEGLLLTADTAATIAVGRPAVTNYLLFVDPQGVAGRNMV